MKTVSFPTFGIVKMMIIPVLLLIAGSAYADGLSEDQVAGLRQQMIVCNSDPIPMHDRCLEIHERLKDHYGGYEGYLAAFPCTNGPDCSRYGIRRLASAEPVDPRLKLEDERRGYDQLTAEAFIEARDAQLARVQRHAGVGLLAERLLVIGRHLECLERDPQKKPSGSHALTCSRIYMDAKLHFVAVAYEEYVLLPLEQRNELEERGRLLLEEWITVQTDDLS